MSIYIQKQDELFINTEGLAGTNTKPGIFLFNFFFIFGNFFNKR